MKKKGFIIILSSVIILGVVYFLNKKEVRDIPPANMRTSTGVIFIQQEKEDNRNEIIKNTIIPPANLIQVDNNKEENYYSGNINSPAHSSIIDGGNLQNTEIKLPPANLRRNEGNIK